METAPQSSDVGERLEWRNVGALWRNFRRKSLLSFRDLAVVPALSIAVYLLHLPDFRKDFELFSHTFVYLITFGVVFIGLIWVIYFAIWTAVAAWRFLRTRSLEFGYRYHLLLSAIAALASLYGSRFPCGALFHGLGESYRPLRTAPFLMTYGASFLILIAFRSYRERLNALKTATVEAQYNALKNQLRPHFLFNSLNSLSELIEKDKDLAVEMTQKLSDLYRQLLINSTARTPSLRSELDIIEKYLEIEQFRFEERLRYSIRCPKNPETIFLPSLMLCYPPLNFGPKGGIVDSEKGAS